MTKTLSFKTLKQTTLFSIISSATILMMVLMSFMVLEPTVSRGQVDVSNDFRIRQTITAESSFLVEPSNVTMAGSINGVTGGNATGTTQFVVQSNNAAGYYVEIDFEDNGSPEAMAGDATVSPALRDYSGDVGGQPSFNFTASTAAQFAYTVYSTTSTDTAQSFRNNGTNVCNFFGGSQIIGQCWKSPTTTAFRIVQRDSSAITGATSTVQFRVHVPSGAVPVPVAQTYTATATLSLFLL